VVAVGGELVFFVSRGSDTFRLGDAVAAAAPDKVGNVERIADVLFSQYLLPFEVASVLLLAAVVGSVLMAKRKV
jgi:NADH-quinone oxidoreductase subunit J